jgi:hypothetical protein
MNRYLNQDVTPWLTKFADIDCEIEMHKTLLELLRPSDMKYRKAAARYFYFQAMAWYEYATRTRNRAHHPPPERRATDCPLPENQARLYPRAFPAVSDIPGPESWRKG